MKRIAFILLVLPICFLTAQSKNIRYHYDCKLLVSTDDARAPQSSFSYNTKENSVTIKPNNGSAGVNNVAWRLDRSNTYYFGNDKTWLVVECENIRLNKLSNSCPKVQSLGNICPRGSETSLVLRKDQSQLHPRSSSLNPTLSIPASGALHTAHSQECHKGQWIVDSCHLTRQRS